MGKLVLPLKAKYFDAIRDGAKTEEYRLDNAYWQKRLLVGGEFGTLARSFDGIVLTKGYPKSDDHTRRMELPWRGWTRKTITHPHFGLDPVDVFAIAVSGRCPGAPPMTTSDQERAAPAQQPVSPSDPQWIIAGIRQFGLAPDGSDLRDLEAALARSEPELRAEIVRLTRERDEARGIVRDIHWMAVRYADNRKSYAVGMCNDALRKAYDGGWLVHKGDKRHALDPQYARHGLFDAEWRSAVDAATGRAEAAESRIEALLAEVGTARAAAFEEAAQIADEHARNAWRVAEGEGQNDVCASGRNHGARDIATAIRSRAALDKGATT